MEMFCALVYIQRLRLMMCEPGLPRPQCGAGILFYCPLLSTCGSVHISEHHSQETEKDAPIQLVPRLYEVVAMCRGAGVTYMFDGIHTFFTIWTTMGKIFLQISYFFLSSSGAGWVLGTEKP
jgi:hypothetical protein